MEQSILILIYTHALLGGIGLLTGLMSISVKKGGVGHRKTGKIFTYTMLGSSVISLIIARLPRHENLFLFLIGIFTIYMILAGNRALTLKKNIKTKADGIDKLVSGSMLVVSISMIILGVMGMVQHITNSALYLFFGGFGAFMSLKDFQTFKVFTEKKNAWLISHLGRMIGALIASFTAFLVAGLSIGTVTVWILPTLLGTVYILYWNRKLTKSTALKTA